MATAAIGQGEQARAEAVARGRIPLAALAGAAIAIVGDLVLFLIGRATGAIPEAVPLPNVQTFGIVPIISITISAAIGAAVVYAILGAIGRIRRPITVFRVVALGVFLLMFLSPFTIADVGVGFVAFLEAMHLLTAAAIVWSLTTLARHQP